MKKYILLSTIAIGTLSFSLECFAGDTPLGNEEEGDTKLVSIKTSSPVKEADSKITKAFEDFMELWVSYRTPHYALETMIFGPELTAEHKSQEFKQLTLENLGTVLNHKKSCIRLMRTLLAHDSDEAKRVDVGPMLTQLDSFLGDIIEISLTSHLIPGDFLFTQRVKNIENSLLERNTKGCVIAKGQPQPSLINQEKEEKTELRNPKVSLDNLKVQLGALLLKYQTKNGKGSKQTSKTSLTSSSQRSHISTKGKAIQEKSEKPQRPTRTRSNSDPVKLTNYGGKEESHKQTSKQLPTSSSQRSHISTKGKAIQEKSEKPQKLTRTRSNSAPEAPSSRQRKKGRSTLPAPKNRKRGSSSIPSEFLKELNEKLAVSKKPVSKKKEKRLTNKKKYKEMKKIK